MNHDLSLKITNKERGGEDKLNWVIKLNVLKENRKGCSGRTGPRYDGENFGGLQVKLVFSLFKFHKSTTLEKLKQRHIVFLPVE